MKFVTPPRYGHAVFCDDLREEAGNKLSYMGTYRGVLVSGAPLPVAFPKFVVVANFSEPLADSPMDMTVRIYGPGQEDGDTPLFEMTVPASVSADVEAVADLPVENQRRELMMPVTFAPFQVQAGRIRVHVVRGDEIHRIGSLLIREPDASASAIASESGAPAS